MGLNLFTTLGAIELYTKIPVLENFPTWGWILFMIIGLLIAPFYAFHKLRKHRDEIAEQLTKNNKKKEIRESLGAFIETGRELKTKCADEKEPPPNDEAQEWADSIENYLTQELDNSYVFRFRSSAGVPMTANSISSIPHRNLWGAIHTRIFQLDKFFEQLGN